MFLNYKIDDKILRVKAPNDTKFFVGENICFSDIYDITKNTSWYKKGFIIKNFSNIISFAKIKDSITLSIKKIILKNHPEINLNNFKLEKYHEYITSDQHLKLDKIYKRLYPKDLGFDDKKIIDFISKEVGKDLSYKNENIKNFDHWIIIRIIMPSSTKTLGYNPAHKDIYEEFDERNHIPKMVNTWIPICGVNKCTGLPLAISSHLYKESEILRTKSGAIIEGQKYSVNCIKSWGGNNQLKIISPKEGELIIFSSHLIHGLAKNYNIDQTRVSLEFRLHKNNIKKY